MTKIFLKELASTKFSFFNEDSIRPEFREPFVEWYEQHITVMNILEMPMNPKTGEGFYPSYDVLRLKNIGPENVSAGTVTGVAYEFTIKTESDALPVTKTILGEFIPTYADLILQLTNEFPNVSFVYNQVTETNGGTHSITAASRFPAEEPQTTDNDNGGTVTTGIFAPSVINIIKFGNETTSPLLQVTETTDGAVAVHPPIELAPILPQHLLITQDTGDCLTIVRGANDPLVIPNGDVANVQELVDYINSKFGSAYAYVYRTYDSPIPTYLDGATSAYAGNPLVFGLLVQFPIPSSDEVTDPALLPEAAFRSTQEAETYFANGIENFVRIADYEQGIGNEYTIDKNPNVANGIWLYDVLVGTEISLGAGKTWIADAITPEVDDRFLASIVEILKKMIGGATNFLAAFGRDLASAGLDAGRMIKDLAALAADGVLAAIQTLAALTDAAINLATGAIGTVLEAINSLGASVTAYITERIEALAAVIAGWLEFPPSIDDKLDAATALIDNQSIAPYLPIVPPATTTGSESDTETKKEENDNTLPITDESPVTKPVTTNPPVTPPIDNQFGGMSES